MEIRTRKIRESQSNRALSCCCDRKKPSYSQSAILCYKPIFYGFRVNTGPLNPPQSEYLKDDGLVRILTKWVWAKQIPMLHRRSLIYAAISSFRKEPRDASGFYYKTLSIGLLRINYVVSEYLRLHEPDFFELPVETIKPAY